MAPTALADILPQSIISKTVVPKGEAHVHGGEDLTPLQALAHGDVAAKGRRSQSACSTSTDRDLHCTGYPPFQSVAEKRQWQLEHMAAAFRFMAREGYCEGISGHISVRDPEHADAFWMNPLGVHFGLLKTSDMILLNLKGEVIGGNRSKPANSAGFLIHSEIHKARPDVNAICHFHGIHGRAWSGTSQRK